jgi:hypothetical protein
MPDAENPRSLPSVATQLCDEVRYKSLQIRINYPAGILVYWDRDVISAQKCVSGALGHFSLRELKKKLCPSRLEI